MLLLYLRQNLFKKKTAICITEAVVLKTTVEFVKGCGSISCFNYAGRYEYADRNRHFFTVNQVVKHGRGFPLNPVLVDVNTRRFVGPVLIGHIDPIVSGSAGEDL